MSLSEYAKTWVGKRFNGNAIEQCMLFVRHCLIETQHPLAHKVTNMAIDGLPTSFAMASSLAGKDCGKISADVNKCLLCFFQNTYGSWPDGTITHVGIPIGEGKFVHRPTASRPVEEASFIGGYWGSVLRCGLQDVQPQQVGRVLKYFLHDGTSALLIDGEQNTSGFMLDNIDGPHITLNKKSRQLLSVELKAVFEDG